MRGDNREIGPLRDGFDMQLIGVDGDKAKVTEVSSGVPLRNCRHR